MAQFPLVKVLQNRMKYCKVAEVAASEKYVLAKLNKMIFGESRGENLAWLLEKCFANSAIQLQK